MYDVVINNGLIVDGTGAPGYLADVAVKGDAIIAMGQIEGGGLRTIDATGKVVAPGFIDLHSHADFQFFIDPTADSKITQGVTLELVGNCGMSFCAPLTGLSKEDLETRVGWYETDWRPTWTSFSDYLDALAKTGKTLNIATQVGVNGGEIMYRQGGSRAEMWRLKSVPPVAFNQERPNLTKGGLDVQGGYLPPCSQGLFRRRDERPRGGPSVRATPGHGAQDARVLRAPRVSTATTGSQTEARSI